MPLPLEPEECAELADFIDALSGNIKLIRDSTCRMAYLDGTTQLFVNGCRWNTDGVSSVLIKKIANHRQVSSAELVPFLEEEDNQQFLYELWKLQWLVIVD